MRSTPPERQRGRPPRTGRLAGLFTEAFLRRAVADGRTVADLADVHGCSVRTVRRYLADWGINPPSTGRDGRAGRHLTDRQLWDEYVVKGRSTAAIAAAAGCAPSTVARRLRAAGVPVRP